MGNTFFFYREPFKSEIFVIISTHNSAMLKICHSISLQITIKQHRLLIESWYIKLMKFSFLTDSQLQAHTCKRGYVLVTTVARQNTSQYHGLRNESCNN